MRKLRPLFVTLVLAGCGGQSARPAPAALPAGVEAMSLLGDTLRPLALPVETRALYQARLDSAREAVAANPDDPEALIWLGRRTAYLGQYREAIAIFGRGIERWPDDARFYRHRGHRWISVREFDRAAADLARAATLVEGRPDVVEPDGLPNARNVPTSTLQFNIQYHLGLAHYLRRRYSDARAAYERCLAVSLNNDAQVATRYWYYLTLRRLGRHDEARDLALNVAANLDIIENRSYHRLLLVFKRELSADSVAAAEGIDGATLGYGLGAWHAAEGRAAAARAMLERARAGGQWAAFGYIAAEADLARITTR